MRIKRIVSFLLCPLLLTAAALPFAACGEVTPAATTAATTTAVPETTVTTTTSAPVVTTPVEYTVLSVEDYVDKTTAGFIAQVVGFLSGYEFARSNGQLRVAMPDSYFSICQGSYAVASSVVKHTSKLIYNEDTSLWEVWNDDDYSIDILNQYILRDMYSTYQTTAAQSITAGWRKYNVWDMGGGQRSVGAYGLTNRFNYLPQFAGNAENDNWYSYCTEPYLGTDTLGMDAAGMPVVADQLAEMFASVTGDRDNVGWARFFAVCYSLAYIESDIPTIIDEASAVFPAGAYQLSVIEEVKALYAEYPNDWRAAVTAFESRHKHAGDVKETDSTINCGFAVFTMLYGGGDYMDTCRIGSLIGYDCESTCGIALGVVAIINGMENLDETVNKFVWQDGKGLIVNLPTGEDKGLWMYAENLPDRIKITEIVESYRKNFESILLENGGKIEDGKYYIPKNDLSAPESIPLANNGFEEMKTDGWVTEGAVRIHAFGTTGNYRVRMTAKDGDARISQTVSGLVVGQKYRLTAYVDTTAGSVAYLYAKGADGESRAAIYSPESRSKRTSQTTVRRDLYFTATDTQMEIGLYYPKTEDANAYAVADEFILVAVEETSVGTVTLQNVPKEGSPFVGSVAMSITAETDKEVYLKITFANTTGLVVNGKLYIAGRSYATAAFYKTGKALYADAADTLYIPIVLQKGENRVTMDLQTVVYDGSKLTGGASLYIYSAELVTLKDR